MIITDKLRSKILPHLPRDFRKQVVAATGCHENTVSDVLHKQQENLEVAEALVNIAHIHKRKKQSLRRRINSLSKAA